MNGPRVWGQIEGKVQLGWADSTLKPLDENLFATVISTILT